MGGGGKSSKDGDSTIRFAPYLEDAHQLLIEQSQTEGDAIIHSSPYANYTISDPDYAFFGIGYTISSFPSLYDMFGKFQAGLDVETLYNQIEEEMIEGPVTGEVIRAHSAYLDDEVNQTTLPKVKAGYRDANAIMSSSFIVTEGLIEAQKVKAVSKFAGDVKIARAQMATQRWGKHLDWNVHVIEQYMQLTRLYYASKFDYINTRTELDSRDLLWPFTVLDHERAIVAAMNGAAAATVKGDSKASKAIAGLLAGAATGASIPGAGPIGAGVGALIGLAGGLFS